MANYYPMLKYAGGGGGGGSLDGNATPSDVASGKTFYSDDGNNKETGILSADYNVTHQMGFGDTYYMPNGYHENEKFIGPDLAAATPATGNSGDLIIGKSGYANGVKYDGSLDESKLMDYNGGNSNSYTEFPSCNVEVDNTGGNNILDITYGASAFASRDMIKIPGMRYWKKGIVNGTLVADSSHKIYFPKGSVFLMVTNAYHYNTGKVIGTKAYTITTNGGSSSTTALAVPRLTAFATSGEPLKCTLGADTSGPARYYDSDTLYAGYVIIGSCGTACRVEYEITPLLTKFPGFCM